MILQEQIAIVATTQKQKLSVSYAGIQREALPEIKLLKGFATIITGIRRCGKCTLLWQILNKKSTKFFYLNFEDIRLAGFEKDDFLRLAKVIDEQEPDTLYFDEIQVIPHWELFVRQKLDEKYTVVITGSNASLLSTELGTKLTGRHLVHELLPFSYNEFLLFMKQRSSPKSAGEYLQLGGFPEYLKTGETAILTQLLEDILNRDISVRYSIRDITSLKKLTVYLISNIGKPVSANNLKPLFGIQATSTLLEYFSYLESAYIVQFLPLFSYSLKKQIRNPRKVYVIDMGLFTQASVVFTEENGRRLENEVYLHLRRKFREIYYFNEKKECDFVVIKKEKAEMIIQACYELTPENMEREISGLEAALDFFNKKNGIIVTYNQKDTINRNGKKIEIVKLNDFLTM